MNLSSWQQFLTQQNAHWDHRGVSHFNDNVYPQLDAARPILVPLEPWAAIQLAGAEARKFLQGQVTCDMAKVTPQQWQRGANCNIKGRVLFSFYCLQLPDRDLETFILILPRSTTNLAIENLKKYAVFSKVDISIADDYQLIGLIGPLEKIENLTQLHFTSGNSAQLNTSGSVLALPGERYFLLTLVEDAQQLWQQLKNACQLQGYPAWELASIRTGIGDIEADTSAEFLPQLLNYHLTDGISFSKGCYIGQEVVARMAYRGNVKRHLRRASIVSEDLPKLNAPIFTNDSNQSVGNVVNAIVNGPDSIELLVVVTDEVIDGDKAYLDTEKIQKLHFLSLPYAITK